MMAFIQNVGAEVISGIVGGLVVLFAAGFWYKFRTFELRYLNPNETFKQENIREYTAIQVGVGEYIVRMHIRPRKGMILTGFAVTFFDTGWLPWKVGDRRSNKDVFANALRYLNKYEEYEDIPLSKVKGYSYADLPNIHAASKSRIIFEIDIVTTDALKLWQGILGISILYNSDGNPNRKNVNTKCIISEPTKKIPFRAIGKKVLKYPYPKRQKSVSDKEGSQN